MINIQEIGAMFAMLASLTPTPQQLQALLHCIERTGTMPGYSIPVRNEK